MESAKPWERRPEWKNGCITHSAGRGTLLFLLVGVIPTSLAVVGLIHGFREHGLTKDLLPFGLIMTVVLGVGLWLLSYGVRGILHVRKYGTSVFEMDRSPGVIGGELTGAVRLDSRLEGSKGAQAHLVCIHRLIEGDFKRRRVKDHVLWEDKRTIPIQEVSGSGGCTVPISFTIPSNCRETDDKAKDNQVMWKLTIKAEIPGADYYADFEVPVFRIEESISLPSRPLSAAQAWQPALSSGVEVRDYGPDHFEIVLTASGSWKRLLFRGALVAIALTIIGQTAFPKMPVIEKIVAGLFVLGFLWVFVAKRSKKGRLAVSNRIIQVHRGGSGRVEEIPLSEIEHVYTKEVMSSGSIEYRDVLLKCAGGGSVVAAQGVRGRRNAEWVADRIKTAAQSAA